METIGSKRSYALMVYAEMPNNDDDVGFWWVYPIKATGFFWVCARCLNPSEEETRQTIVIDFGV